LSDDLAPLAAVLLSIGGRPTGGPVAAKDQRAWRLYLGGGI
jgi:hypothetical protein